MRLIGLISVLIYGHICSQAIGQTANHGALEAYQWQNRLLLIPIKSRNDIQLFQQHIGYHAQDIDARKLHLMLFNQHHSYILSTSGQRTASTALNAELQALSKRYPNKVMLIGLDGGIKKYYPSHTFSLEKAFAAIDLMPMRRVEIE